MSGGNREDKKTKSHGRNHELDVRTCPNGLTSRHIVGWRNHVIGGGYVNTEHNITTCCLAQGHVRGQTVLVIRSGLLTPPRSLTVPVISAGWSESGETRALFRVCTEDYFLI